jgi:hypothetical protein
MAKRGAPSKYSAEIAATICRAIAQGQSLREVLREVGMPDRVTVLRWLDRHPEFRTQYAQAREDQAEYWAEEILAISDDGSNDWVERETKSGNIITVVDHEHIARSKLRVDTRRWLMSKLLPKKYGERLMAEHSGPDGGPIETSDVGQTELARRIAFLLTQGVPGVPA